MHGKVKLPPQEALHPVPVVLVSCIDPDNQGTNIITIAWCGVVCSKPPLMSISVRPSRHSHRLIQESGDFVVNIPSRDMAKAVDMCGGCSGRDIDKFQALSFTKMPASKVSSPMIGECPINIECRVRQILRLGSHDMFIGEIVAAHVDKAIVDNDGNIDYHKAAPLIYNHGQYWDLGAEIGHYGFSKE